MQRLATAFFAALLSLTPLAGAQDQAGQGLPVLVRSNEQLGVRLLSSLHSASPDQNVAVAPIPVTLMAVMFRRDAAGDAEKVFGWDRNVDLSYPSRMLLGAFDPGPPEPPPVTNAGWMPLEKNALWFTNVLVYRSPAGVKQVFDPWWSQDARSFYRTRLVNIGDRKPQPEDLRNAVKGLALASLPANSRENDFALASAVHLRCLWRGNLFLLTPETEGKFALRSGAMKTVRMLNSDREFLQHAKTDDFEAVSLPCGLGSMTVVIAAQGKTLEDLVQKLEADPSVVSSKLQDAMGILTMPSFDFAFRSELRPVLEGYGFKSVFKELKESVKVPDSKLTEVNQSAHIRVDRHGVFAEAATITGGVVGGLYNGHPFNMVVDRPFLFFIHDNAANVLLFAGTVMDPTQH